MKDTFELDELNESFRSFCLSQPIEVLSYYETFKTKNIAIVVDKASADPGYCSVHPIPVQADHLDICKPRDRNAFIYTSITSRLRNLEKSFSDSTKFEGFLPDELHALSETDRRSLHEKLLAAEREHEY